MNRTIIEIGSNINPEENIPRALALLGEKFKVVSVSSVLVTSPVGYTEQPDFHNCAVFILTRLELERFESEMKVIERSMGRIHSDNKWGPRVIDLDVIAWNDVIISEDDFQRSYVRQNIYEIFPEIIP